MSRFRESSEMTGMVRRVSKAMVRRAEEGDVLALTALVDMRDAIDAATAEAARALHDGPDGLSWTAIGQELGMTRQNARQRFS